MNTLNKKILSRSAWFLWDDFAESKSQIAESLKGSRVLVIGAAGSIGGAFVEELVKFSCKALHLVDISENNLVEVVRSLRSGGANLPEDFKTYSIDFGGPEMVALLAAHQYEYVFNFSALKHVRAERDPFTLMRLMQVNVLANDLLLGELEKHSSCQLAFGVSSDKAVRSGNLMGASKALMERVFLQHSEAISVRSARFANVAFSDGSLLHGFHQRILKRQPLSAPNDVRRYFISHEEAAALCLIGAFGSTKNREIIFPLFDPGKDMMTFSEIAKLFLLEQGYQPLECESADEALEVAANLNDDSREWPCWFSPANTSGEKLFEEFYHPDLEQIDTERFDTLGVVTEACYPGGEGVAECLDQLRTMRDRGEWSVNSIIDAVGLAVPDAKLVKAEGNLDHKM